MDTAFKHQWSDDAEGNESKPMEETSFEECDGIPVLFTREVISIYRDNEEVVKLVPDRTAEGLHEWCHRREDEGDCCFANLPQLVLLVRELV